jgi:proline dehydrogenase
MLTALHRSVIGLAQVPPIRDFAKTSRLTRPLVHRFVAGDTPDDAIALARSLQERKIGTAFDLLGENVGTEAEATQSADDYLRVIELAQKAGIESCYISIKLTALGLDLSAASATANLRRIAESANGGFVRVDMEASDYTQATLDIVAEVHQDFKNVGTVLQSSLFRTDDDLEMLIENGIPVRLVKGAYLEPAAIAHQAKSEVDRAYHRQLARLLASDLPTAIATHDERIIAAAKKQIRERRRPNDSFEFQLLLGVREDLRDNLASEGYHVRVYIPFGSQWYPYLVRRLAERPANLGFMLKNLARR